MGGWTVGFLHNTVEELNSGLPITNPGTSRFQFQRLKPLGDAMPQGYNYIPACGYEFYRGVFNSISHKWAQRTREILSWTWEDRIHIHKLACNILFILWTITNNVFDDFPKISNLFPKISKDFSKLFWMLDKRFRTFSRHFPKIAIRR